MSSFYEYTLQTLLSKLKEGSLDGCDCVLAY